jgi:hypothetical protein
MMLMLTVSHGLLFNNSCFEPASYAGLSQPRTGIEPAPKNHITAARESTGGGPIAVRRQAMIFAVFVRASFSAAAVLRRVSPSRHAHKATAQRSTGESLRIPMRRRVVSLERKFLIRPVRAAASQSNAPGLLGSAIANLGSIPYP